MAEMVIVVVCWGIGLFLAAAYASMFAAFWADVVSYLTRETRRRRTRR